ncbi:CDP-alcohol phosphatidyltransferase family protein [Methanolobus halotolerans]|uniref:Archaetidylinositol phosphate synthase n=1 Tax=Methanolobus halotolerans TaxID=2052935 RepID=A0A4E0Q4E3_9EURY|nr:CDP-alcohol phosphatidyltransferase family protein [Methanolobus halotolerans]TGC08730.1 CDP-alcohol phosphatidyltransferase family protein [Methanolobus halotolerans]
MFSELKSNIRVSILPLAKRIPMSPNSLTLIGLLVSVYAAIQFARGFLVSGALMILLSGLFDAFDGAVARANGSSSAFGAVFDSVCDRYADALIFAGIIYGLIAGSIPQMYILSTPLWLWTVIAIIGSYLVSYTRSRAEAMGAREMDIGIAERPERMLILIAGAMTGMLGASIFIIVVFTHVTVVQRLIHARKSLA